MPRKKLEELEAKPAEKPKAEQMKEMPKYDATVVTEGGTRKVKLDLEVDTSIKDLGPNPYAKIIHMAKAVDAWRIFPRIFLSVYIYLLYDVTTWFMNLPEPNLEQSGLVSIVVGAGAAWFGLYAGTSKKNPDK